MCAASARSRKNEFKRKILTDPLAARDLEAIVDPSGDILFLYAYMVVLQGPFLSALSDHAQKTSRCKTGLKPTSSRFRRIRP